MSVYTRDQFRRLVRNPTPTPLETMKNKNEIPGNNNALLVRTMHDILNPARITHPSCIVAPSVNAQNIFTVKPQHIQMLPHFNGLPSEQPYLHIRDIEEVVHTFCTNILQVESAKMKLFSFSLKDAAKTWFNSLKPQSINDWIGMQDEFYKKYFPFHKTRALKKLIASFCEKEGESFGACWEWYKGLLNAVPHHGFEESQIVAYFYEGISQQSRQFIDTMCNGEFLDKSPSDALNYFDFLAENHQSWDYSDPNERSYSHPTHSHQGGKHVHAVQDDLSLKVDQLTKQLEKFSCEKIAPVASVAREEEICCLSQCPGHPTNQCSKLAVLHDLTSEQGPNDVNSINNFSNNAPDRYRNVSI